MKKFQKNDLRTETTFGTLTKSQTISTIYIGNLRYSKKEIDIKKLFGKYGKVTYVKVVKDPKTEKSKGIAFVQMPNKEAAATAIQKLNGKELDGRTLKVSIAKESHPIEANTLRPRVAKVNVNKDKEKETKPPKRRKRGAGLKVLLDYLNS